MISETMKTLLGSGPWVRLLSSSAWPADRCSSEHNTTQPAMVGGKADRRLAAGQTAEP
jgi:hypothetical protein